MESKSVKNGRRKYDAEFKKEVLRMIEMGCPVPEVGQSLGIGTNLIYQWIIRAFDYWSLGFHLGPFFLRIGLPSSMEGNRLVCQKNGQRIDS